MYLNKINFHSDIHTITIYGREEKGLLNTRRSFGFIWYTMGIKAKYIKRTEFIYNDSELVEKALEDFFHIFEKVKHQIVKKRLLFFIPECIGKLNNSTIEMNVAHAMRLGFDISFETNSVLVEEVIKDVNKANSEFKEIDDFDDTRRIITVCNVTSIDQDLIDSEFTLKQYISRYEKGIPGIEKKILFTEDLATQDEMIIASNIMWPLYTEQLNDLVRRTCMMVRDSEIMVMVSSIVNPSDGEFVDNYHSAIYALCTVMGKPIVVYDVVTLKWYSESVSSKRELVRSGIKSLAQYNSIGFSALFKPYAVGQKAVKKFLNE